MSRLAVNASNSRRSLSTLRKLGELHQVGLAGDHVFRPACATSLDHLLRHPDGVEHQLIEPLAGLLQLLDDVLADLDRGLPENC